MAMTSFPTLDKRQISHTIDIEETEYTKKQLYDACMGLILNNKDGDIKSYKDLKNPQLCYYKDGSKYLHFNGRVGDEYNVRIEGTCDNFDELMNALETGDYEKYKIEQFVKDNFSEYDGHAADKAIDAILLNR